MQSLLPVSMVVLLLGAVCRHVHANSSSLALSDAWVRAMPPGRPMTAAYLQIENPGDSVVRITGVSASEGEASLHETRLENGRSTMRSVTDLSIDAGGAVSLEPGGMHIMLMGLASTPEVGDVIELCVQTTADEVCLDAPVTREGPPTGTGSTNNHAHHP